MKTTGPPGAGGSGQEVQREVQAGIQLEDKMAAGDSAERAAASGVCERRAGLNLGERLPL